MIGGGERYVSYVARALREASESLHQAVFALGETDSSFLDGAVPVTVLRNENPHPDPMMAMSDRLWGALADFDVIHVHQALTLFGCYCAVIARSLDKTLVMTDLGGGACDLLLEHGGLRLADGVLSISAFAKSLVAPYFSGPHAAILGPIDTAFFRPPRQGARQREVLCVGRLLPHKGLDRIIDALPPGLPLRLVGRPYDAAYHALLRERARGKDVTFVLDADDAALAACYQTAGLYVQASTFVDLRGQAVAKPELLGLTTLEALSSGLPIAVADTASLPELARDPRISKVWRTAEELGAILREFAAGLWPAAGAFRIARHEAEANYSLPVVGREILDFYRTAHTARLASA